MTNNLNLNKAKKSKYDEFYTQFDMVEKELTYYKKHLENKIVLCNCDNPEKSAFWEYFHLNFAELGLKKADFHVLQRKRKIFQNRIYWWR